MKGRALLLFIWISYILAATGFGQEPPFAEILTADSSWCQQNNNLTVAEILITGDIDTSRFDLVVDIKGTRDTLVNLSSGIFQLYLNNQVGRNIYIIHKIKLYFQLQNIQEQTCSICMEKVENIPLKCGHAFHDKCVLEWFKVNNTCPNCRCVILNLNKGLV